MSFALVLYKITSTASKVPSWNLLLTFEIVGNSQCKLYYSHYKFIANNEAVQLANTTIVKNTNYCMFQKDSLKDIGIKSPII